MSLAHRKNLHFLSKYQPQLLARMKHQYLHSLLPNRVFRIQFQCSYSCRKIIPDSALFVLQILRQSTWPRNQIIKQMKCNVRTSSCAKKKTTTSAKRKTSTGVLDSISEGEEPDGWVFIPLSGCWKLEQVTRRNQPLSNTCADTGGTRSEAVHGANVR